MAAIHPPAAMSLSSFPSPLRASRAGAPATRPSRLCAAANGLALAWPLFAVTRPWITGIWGHPQRGRGRRRLLFAPVGAAAVPALVARPLPEARRSDFLHRHFAI